MGRIDIDYKQDLGYGGSHILVTVSFLFFMCFVTECLMLLSGPSCLTVNVSHPPFDIQG